MCVCVCVWAENKNTLIATRDILSCLKYILIFHLLVVTAVSRAVELVELETPVTVLVTVTKYLTPATRLTNDSLVPPSSMLIFLDKFLKPESPRSLLSRGLLSTVISTWVLDSPDSSSSFASQMISADSVV